MGCVGAAGRAATCRREAEAAGREGRRLIVVLDTGGVEGLAPIDEKRRARLRALREHADDIVVPAAVLAEGLLSGHVGHDHHVRHFLRHVHVAPTTESIGYAAGSMRQAAIRATRGTRPPSGVDAVVLAEADARATSEDVRIITSDDDDLELLASLASNAARLAVLAP